MYKIIKHGKCYSVVNTKTNKLHSRCSTVKNANKQLRLLNAIDHGFQPAGRGLKRKVGLYSPSMRKLLSQVGSEPVKSIKIVRTPIEKFIKGLLNVISLGKYDQAVKESGYEEMLHLSLFINETYTLDKQAVVVLAKKNPIKNTSETMEVKSIPEGITIQSLIDKTKEYMGDEKFSNYSSKDNNCQDFLLAVLQSNGILNDELKSFIKQDADAVFQKMPKISEKIAKVITDVGAVANKVVEGENIDSHANGGASCVDTKTKNIDDNKMTETETSGTGTKTRKPNKWLLLVKKTMAMKKNKGKSFKQILQIAKASYKK